MTEQTGGRRVVTNMSLSLDGRYAAPDNPMDMSWVMPYAVTDVARDHLTSLWEPATTALLGRVNAEGFLGFWPTVIDMEGADPRDEGFAKWLVDTDKVVFSSTLGEAPGSARRSSTSRPPRWSRSSRRPRAATSGCSPARASSRRCWRPTRSTGWRWWSSRSSSAAGRDSSTTACPRGSGRWPARPPASTGTLCLVYDRVR